MLWQVSTKWLVLSQLVHVNVDLVVITFTMGLTTILASNVVSRAL
jgi:hypothetical protein